MKTRVSTKTKKNTQPEIIKILSLFLPSHYGNQRLKHNGKHIFTEYVNKVFDHDLKETKEIFYQENSPLNEISHTRNLKTLTYFIPKDEDLRNIIIYRNINKDVNEQIVEIHPDYDLHLVKELEFDHVESENVSALFNTVVACINYLQSEEIPFKLVESEIKKHRGKYELNNFASILSYNDNNNPIKVHAENKLNISSTAGTKIFEKYLKQ